jgi:hypothetical protein
LRCFGVPANRLLLSGVYILGGVNLDGPNHVLLFYKPNNYPLDFVALDWCYEMDDALLPQRAFFEFFNHDIIEWKRNGSSWEQGPNPYLQSWFFFNESFSCWGYNHQKVAP